MGETGIPWLHTFYGLHKQLLFSKSSSTFSVYPNMFGPLILLLISMQFPARSPIWIIYFFFVDHIKQIITNNNTVIT